jgi:hypothetical protein
MLHARQFLHTFDRPDTCLIVQNAQSVASFS